MSESTYVERIPTGIVGLDPILEGGLLKGGAYLIYGPPGAGKTIFGNQICFTHAKSGGSVVFITLLAESHERMLSHLRRMAFFDAALIPDKIYYLSGFKILEADGLDGLLRATRESITSRKASLLVIDGFVSVEEASPTPKHLKKFIHELQTIAGMTGCTVLLLGGLERSMTARPEHTMVDGIIELSDELKMLGPLRHLRIRKMRGTAPIRGQHAIEITNEGIIVRSRMEARFFEAPHEGTVTPDGEKVALGIPDLDAMLKGGLPGSSITMLLGPSGSGKTIMALQYLAEGARRGEPGVYFGFYERPEAIRAKSDRLNLGVSEFVKKGLIEIVWQPPIEGVIDLLGERLLSTVTRTKAQRLVIDGMQGFQLALDDYPNRLRGVFSSITDELERQRVTSIYTVETRDLLGPVVEVPITGISAVTQNLILFRYAELKSKFRRLLSIIKIRDSDFDSSIRELHIKKGGITLTPIKDRAEQLLTGSALTLSPSTRERHKPRKKAGAIQATKIQRTRKA